MSTKIKSRILNKPMISALENLDNLASLNEVYFISWEEISGEDNLRLIDVLKSNYDVDWVKTAKIDKYDNPKKIMLTAGKNSISMKLYNENKELNLTINKNRSDKFIVKTENGKQNIYKIGLSVKELKDEVCEYWFNWNNIPDKDIENLKKPLIDVYECDWVKTAKIDKIDDGKTISIISGENKIILHYDGKLTFKINGDDQRITLRNEKDFPDIYISENPTAIYDCLDEYNLIEFVEHISRSDIYIINDNGKNIYKLYIQLIRELESLRKKKIDETKNPNDSINPRDYITCQISSGGDDELLNSGFYFESINKELGVCIISTRYELEGNSRIVLETIIKSSLCHINNDKKVDILDRKFEKEEGSGDRHECKFYFRVSEECKERI